MKKGFTLVEVVIALTLVSILSFMCISVITSFNNSKQRITDKLMVINEIENLKVLTYDYVDEFYEIDENLVSYELFYDSNMKFTNDSNPYIKIVYNSDNTMKITYCSNDKTIYEVVKNEV